MVFLAVSISYNASVVNPSEWRMCRELRTHFAVGMSANSWGLSTRAFCSLI